MDMEKKLLEILEKNLHDAGNIDIEYKFNDGDMDSVAFIQTVVELEAAFGIEFENDLLLMEYFPDVKSLLDYIHKRMNNSGS